MFGFLGKYRDFGLLILRVGLGAMYLTHGAPKLMGGPAMWVKVGSAMGYVGMHAVPVFCGFMAAASEFLGAICLILGLFFRPACMFMTITMAVAASMHLGKGDGLNVASHAIENGIVFIGLIFIGPGKYSIDRK
jgi:putative oxidoreductase